jgi:pimeloyl-ACP methyl ester carboxylesterase
MAGARRIQRSSREGLNYVRNGAGPTVVLVHGWCLSRRVWMYLEYGLVASGHSVITLDLAGFGGSAALAPRTSLAEHASDVIDLLDELDVKGAVLAGFAFGAAVILSAQDYRRVGALVSLAIPSAATAPYPRMRSSILKDWPRFAARSSGAILSQPASDETKQWLAGIFEATSLEAALAGLEILEKFEPSELTRRWDVPAIFAHGADDPIVPAAVSRSCAERLDGGYVEIASSGHLVVIDQKEAVQSVVEDAVARSRRIE